ncbi:type III secretion system gatekeeper subunit SctW [Serratia silvae]|uniref:Type III secretion system gatekeeper subunit SctW n=1 Tax=Serratia silvae TaxID=2824122 RepID=A0ABT0K9U1_9GAMM|nr:type III secretion system gatekeeper subunit SctW [Serratia silvae]MCL1028799.1 type III secretion system gatekeeper subunit SctW [Serratia silvae]
MAIGIGGGNTNFNYISDQHGKKLAAKQESLSTNDTGVSDEVLPVEDESPGALLQRFADSTDEMSAVLAQFRNRRDLEKKTGAGAESSFDRVLDEDVHEKVDQILKAVKGTAGLNVNDLLRFVKSLFPDDSDLILVLREMLRRRNLDKVTKGKLEHLLQQAEQQADPKTLKAGINVALKARLFGKALDMSPGLMRESYRNFISSEQHEVLLYQDWVVSYGPEHRTIVVDFMESALISDIDALDPSCSLIEFGSLLSRIGQVKLLRSSDISFVKALMNSTLVKSLGTSERDWLFMMLGVLQSAELFEEYFKHIIKDPQGVNKKTLSQLINLIYRLYQKIPEQLFLNATNKTVLEQELKRCAQEYWLEESIEQRRRIAQQRHNEEHDQNE